MAIVGDPERLLGVLLDHQDGHTTLADVEQQIEDDLEIGRRKTRGRLVEQQQLRLAHQRPAHRHHLPLAAGQLARRLIELAPEVGKQRQHVLANLFLVLWRRGIGADIEVLIDRERREHVAALRHHGNAERHQLRRPQTGDVLACEADFTLQTCGQGKDGLEQCRLAGAVRPDDDGDLVFGHVEIDALDDRNAAIAGSKPLDRQQRTHDWASYFPPPK
jgi:hypothetical protein